ncbi:MAG: Dabb family protein [Eubacteriales bacterium]|nr:Dabb family protein [Eubacteriales bacterium]
MIKHIVMWRFPAEADGKSKAENMAQLTESLFALRAIIPEIESMEIGTDIGIGRDPFDMVLVTTFENEEALERYQEHPEHKLVSAFCGRIRESRASIDFEFERA